MTRSALPRRTARITTLIGALLAMLMIASACGSDTDSDASQDTVDTEVAATIDETETAASDSDADAEGQTEPVQTANEDVLNDAAAEQVVDAGALNADDTDAGDTAEPEAGTGDAVADADDPISVGATGMDISNFFDGALAGEPTIEPCTLSGGDETMCYRITVTGDPMTYETGPFCPSTLTDSAEAGGIWFDGNGVYELDGAFFETLSELYDDTNWKMYDDDGNILVTETAEEFDLAARPDVDPSLQNHCVEGRLEWLANGEPVTSTVLIPVEPVLADGPSNTRGNLGVTFDGVVIAQSAPVDAILSAYTIAAFDDCGGHYNPTDGYHLHGARRCSEIAGSTGDETGLFAYAIDGFGVHSPLDDPSSADLDECNGHETEIGYHYHANGAEQNLVIECLIGQTVATAGAGGGGGGGGGARPPRDE